MAVLQSKIDTIKNERQVIQDKIKEAMNPGGEKNSVLNELRTKMNALKNTKNVLIEEKKVLRAKLDLSKASADKLQKDKKDVKSNLKFSSMSEIETAIKKLQITHEASSVCEYVTVSVGVSTIIPTHECDLNALIHAADKALYQAKSQGRDRVTMMVA